MISCDEPIADKERENKGGTFTEVKDFLPRNGESGITYQLLVYSFADSNGDGIGDINGIISKLDYLKDMGVSALWLSPIHPSASYHGYDVKDYEAINPDFGTEADFKKLIDAAHSKGVKIYLDFVLNHTSRSHPWFIEAKKSADSKYRNYYIFSESPQEDIKAGRIPMIATEGGSGYDGGQWYSTGVGKYKYHSHFWTDWFADLNYGAAATCEQSEPFKEITKAADKWIKMGVDGFRLDAIKHIYHNAYSDENPTFLKKFYDHCNATYKDAGGKGEIYMVGEHFSEAKEVAPYYKGLPAYFEFSFWWRLKDAISSGKGASFATTIQSYTREYAKYRTDFIAATKLTNHDENRAGSDLGGYKARMQLAAAVLLTAGGQPYIYQGEELGYTGTKNGGDEYVRAPILWRSGGGVANKYLGGKTRPISDAYSVEAQKVDEASVLALYTKFGDLRDRYLALSKGTFENCNLFGDKEAIAAWWRTQGDQKLLVVHNFGAAPVTLLPNVPYFKTLLAANGSVSQKSASELTLGGYSTAVFIQ